MSYYYDELQASNFQASTIKATNSIECPSITIGGSVFNGDVSGGVTLPYLDTNYVKKVNATVLNDLTSNATEVVSTKTVNAPNLSTGNVNASNVYTSMTNFTDGSAVNKAYVTGQFPVKTDVYTKTASDAITNTLLPSATFSAFQATNAQNIATKENAGVAYTKAETTNLLTGKVDTASFGSYQQTVTTALASKASVGDSYTKTEVNNITSGYLPLAYGTSNDAAVNGKVAQSTFDNYVASAGNTSGGKANTADVYTKTQTDNLVGQRVLSTDFSTYQTGITNALGQKVSNTDFATYQGVNTTALNGKVSNTDFGNYQSTVTNNLATKYNVADFNTFNTANNSALGNKVNVSDFSTYSNSNNANVASRVLQTDYDSNKTSTNSAIALKRDIATSYSATQVDSKDATIQSSLDSYKTSNDASVASKVAQTVYDSYVSSNNSSVASKAPQASTYSKSETDSLVSAGVVAGTGLTKSGSTLSVNPAQSQITSVGSLSSLTVTGATSLASGTIYATPSGSSDITSKGYVDGATYLTAGTGLTRTGASFAVNPAQTQITSVGTLGSLTVSGATSLASGTISTAPSGSSDITNKVYVDSNISTAGTGLTKTGTVLSVNPAQTQVTDVGTLNSLTVNGNLTTKQIIQNPISSSFIRMFGGQSADGGASAYLQLQGGGNVNNGICLINLGNTADASTGYFKVQGGSSTSQYMLISSVGTTSIGSSTQLTVNASGVTTVNNPTDSGSTLGGALLVSGGVGILKNVFVGGEINITNSSAARIRFVNPGNSISIGAVAGDAAGDWHVYDSTGGSRILGWGRSSNLLALGYTNGTSTVVVSGAADSSSAGTGSLQVMGGIGVTKSIFVGGTSSLTNANVSGALGVTGALTVSGASVLGLVNTQGLNSTSAYFRSGNNTSMITLSDNSTAYRLEVEAGVESNVGSWVDMRTQGNGSKPFLQIRNNGGTMTLPLATTFGSSMTQGIYSHTIEDNTYTPTYSYAKSLVIRSNNATSSIYDSINFKDSLGATRAYISLSGTMSGELLETTRGYLSLGADGFVGTAAGYGTKYNSAGNMEVIATVNGGLSTRAFSWNLSGGYNVPLMTLSGVDGRLTSGNFDSSTIVNGTYQAVVTFTKSVDVNSWEKTGKLVACYVNFQTTAVSGTASGPLTVMMPYPANYTAVVDTFVVIKNGTQVTMRLQFTAGLATVTMLEQNGVGGFRSTTPAAADKWHVMFTYGCQ